MDLGQGTALGARARRRARSGAAVAVALACGVGAHLADRRGDDRVTERALQAPVVPALVDLNAAGVDELALLPGVGPSIAARIVSDRTERGPFASVDEIRRVKGIGAATLERVRAFATAGQAT
jgi:competence ComEA-like helix-hairpin-helix protein